MAMENKRIIQLSTERLNLSGDDYVMVDSATDGSAKYRLDRLKETDSTLSVSGMAADAAATGQAINAETQARTQAVAAETQARQQAISAESQARAAADTTLGNDVQDLKSALSTYYLKSRGNTLSDSTRWVEYSNDANNLTPNTVYAVWYNTNIQNLPTNNFLGAILCLTGESAVNSSKTIQIAVPAATTSYYYLRVKMSSTTWESWKRYDSTANIEQQLLDKYISPLQKDNKYQQWLNDYYFIPGKNIVNIYDTLNIKENCYYSGSALNSLSSYNTIAIKIDKTKSAISINKPNVFINFFSHYEEGKLSTESVNTVFPNYISQVITNGSDTDNWNNISIPQNAEWMIVSASKTAWENLQIEYATARTAFEAYKKTLNPIVNVSIKGTETVVQLTDYTNLRDCLESISPSANAPVVVEIPSGTYDLKSYYTSDEIADESFRGLYIPDYCILRGIGIRENTILKWENDANDINTMISTLNIRNVAGMENLTVLAKNIRYCVHDDMQTAYNSIDIRNVKNCIFKKQGGGYNCAYGAGIRGNAQWNFENCIFIADNVVNANYFTGLAIHNNENLTKDSNIYIKNCRVENTVSSEQEFRFGSFTDNSPALNYIYFIGNKMSHTTSKIQLYEIDPVNYGKGTRFKISGYGNAFSNNDVDIVVTDGQDYSSYVDLV